MKTKNSKLKTKPTDLQESSRKPSGGPGRVAQPSPVPGPPSPPAGWAIIHPKKPETLPPESGTYAVIYYQATKNGDQFTGRQIEKYNADKNQWHTGMRSVKILAWLQLPEIPEELIIQESGTSDLAESGGPARVAGTATKVKRQK